MWVWGELGGCWEKGVCGKGRRGVCGVGTEGEERGHKDGGLLAGMGWFGEGLWGFGEEGLWGKECGGTMMRKEEGRVGQGVVPGGRGCRGRAEVWKGEGKGCGEEAG